MNPLLKLSKEKVVVGAWSVELHEVENEEKCRRIRELGLDFIYFSIGEKHEYAKIALDACEKQGLGVFAFDPQVSGLPMDRFWVMKNALADYASHPALYGTVLRDEPGVYDLPRLALLAKTYYEVTEDKLPGVNLFPSYASPLQFNYVDFATYVDRCAAEIDLPYISYDHYPLYGGGGRTWVQDHYLSDFEIVSDACKKYGRDMWYFIQTLGFNKIVRDTNEQDIRWQVYCALSFGVRAIQLFTYGSPGDENGDTADETFELALIDRQGEKTPRYGYTQNVLKELRGFDGSYVQYAHVGTMLNKAGFAAPEGGELIEVTFPGMVLHRRVMHNYLDLAHPLDRFDPIASIGGEGPVMAGCFEKEGGQKAFTLVNVIDPGRRQGNRAEVKFASPVTLRVYDKGVPTEVRAKDSFVFDLECGQGIFVEIIG